jgi:hypothetical protein
MVPWVVGIVVLMALGVYIAEKAGSAIGSGLGKAIGGSVGNSASTITSTTIANGTPSGVIGSVSLGAGDSLVVSTYPAPAGYVWRFSGSTGALATSAVTATGATFSKSPTSTGTTDVVYVTAVKAGATVAPFAVYKINVAVS